MLHVHQGLDDSLPRVDLGKGHQRRSPLILVLSDVSFARFHQGVERLPRGFDVEVQEKPELRMLAPPMIHNEELSQHVVRNLEDLVVQRAQRRRQDVEVLHDEGPLESIVAVEVLQDNVVANLEGAGEGDEDDAGHQSGQAFTERERGRYQQGQQGDDEVEEVEPENQQGQDADEDVDEDADALADDFVDR
eukprot:scaffold2061_cov246-Pinguiococcus_pyrenoidosus.AAC.9